VRQVGPDAQALRAAGERGEHLGQCMHVQGVPALQQQRVAGVVMRFGLVQ
jgi:hypothetical protein